MRLLLFFPDTTTQNGSMNLTANESRAVMEALVDGAVNGGRNGVNPASSLENAGNTEYNGNQSTTFITSGIRANEGAGDVSIYHAVGPEEFYDLFENKQFRTTDTSMYAKQFGFDFDETLKYANWSPDAAAIIEVKIPDSVLKDIGDFTPLDTPIFKHGTVTIYGDQLDIFNKYISDIFHFFQLGDVEYANI